MFRAAFVLLILAACEVDHHAKLELGPPDTSDAGWSLSTGFRCHAMGGPNAPPLIAQNYDGVMHSASFTLVVDVIDLADQFPNCQIEDLYSACAGGQCKLLQSAAPTRFCEPITITNLDAPGDIYDRIPAALEATAKTVFSHASHHPVLLRAVTLPGNTSCATLQMPISDSAGALVYAGIMPADALGCGFSCPQYLDDANGIISIELNLAKIVTNDFALCTGSITNCVQYPVVTAQ